MKTTSVRAKALGHALQSGTLKGTLCALLAGTALCGLAAPSSAQSPTFRNLDSNGVDLVRGDFLASFAEGSIGSGESELALLRMLGAIGTGGAKGSSQWDHITFNLSPSGNLVQFNTRADQFPAAESRGASLTGSGAQFYYRSPDGTRIEFTDPSPGNDPMYCDGIRTDCILLPTTFTSPDGKAVTINYEFYVRCQSPDGPDSTVCQNVARIASATNSFGYEIRFAYAVGTGGTGPVSPDFHKRTGASFYNNAVSSAPLASVGYSYPSAGVTDITDQGGRVWRVTSSSTNYAIRRPGAASDTASATLSGGVVASVTSEGVTTNYSRSVSGTTGTMTVTNALSQSSTIVSDLTIGRPTSLTDPLSRTTSFTYDGGGRLKRTTAPEGNYVEHSYDARGNVTQTVAVPKGGSGPTIVTSASFDSSCSNPVTCNSPNSTTDARGNVTSYTYNATHGGVETVTAPAVNVGVNLVSPQTRYSYTLTNGEYRVTGVSQCQTGSSCVGTADEVKTALAYDSNGNLYWTATGNGTGSLVAVSAMTFDALGNMLTVDGPLSGSADTGRARYNSARQVIGSISPDPDGAGALKHRAVRNTYDSSTGLLTKVEQGNVNSQSDSDWAAFVPAQAVETVYDSNARPIVSKLTSGSTVYSLGQTSYDSLGRPQCSVQRMNPAVFGSVPSTSACTLGTQGSGAGDYGPDRISKTFYDAAGQVTEVRTALGTADEASEGTTTYTANGQVQTVTDGENNKTSYEYDGHDRLSKTYYPMPTKGAGASNGSDYEQSTYESLAGGTRTSGLVVAFRNRANESTGFGYDALGRMTSKDRPGSEPDIGYSYDLLGRMKSASFTSTGLGISSSYDALGRETGTTTNLDGVNRTYSFQHDLAGNRTRIAHPDGPWFDYGFDGLGRMTTLKDSAAATLVTMSYDDSGRRSGAVYGNGVVTSYGYDPAGRLASLAHDFAGTAQDVAFAYAYNPASQIVSRTGSNDLYAWTGHGSGSLSSAGDGLNRLATHGGAAVGYDAKGNLTSEGGRTLSYDSENRLTNIVTPQLYGLLYDPLGRFRAVDLGSATGAWDSLGTDLVAARIDGGATTERYVFGPGVDEPLVGFDNSGALYYFHADERGSIVANSGSAGSPLRTIAYDEYGRPSVASSRFLYAGKMHFGGVSAYYSNARLYDYKLGRFLQADPIGYGDGMNMYAYVGGDPVNFTDPTGLCRDENGDWFYPPTGSHICDGHGPASTYGGIAGHTSGFSSAGAAGAGGPTFGEAYAAARGLVGDYGSSAVNAATNYLMGTGGLTEVGSFLAGGIPPTDTGPVESVQLACSGRCKIFGIILRPAAKYIAQSEARGLGLTINRAAKIGSGGRSGGNVSNLVGPPNSVVGKPSGNGLWFTNSKGQVVRDLTFEGRGAAVRAKEVIPGRGFGAKQPLSPAEWRIWRGF